MKREVHRCDFLQFLVHFYSQVLLIGSSDFSFSSQYIIIIINIMYYTVIHPILRSHPLRITHQEHRILEIAVKTVVSVLVHNKNTRRLQAIFTNDISVNQKNDCVTAAE